MKEKLRVWLFVSAWYLRTTTPGALILFTVSIVLGGGLIMLAQGCSPSEQRAALVENVVEDCLACKDKLAECEADMTAWKDEENDRLLRIPACKTVKEEREYQPYVCRYRVWDEKCLAPLDDACLKKGKCDQNYRKCSTTHTVGIAAGEMHVDAALAFERAHSCGLAPIYGGGYIEIAPIEDCVQPEGEVECALLLDVASYGTGEYATGKWWSGDVLYARPPEQRTAFRIGRASGIAKLLVLAWPEE